MQRDLGGVAVIFDLDGTLVDTAADLAAAMNHALAAAGRRPIPPRSGRDLIGHGAAAMLLQAFAETAVVLTREEMEGRVAARLDDYFAHIADHSRPFSGAIAAIEEQRLCGAACAICTNRREAQTRSLLAALRMTSLFDGIVGADTAGARKPDPAPAPLCLALTGARKAVFVGDSDGDIRAAKAANLPCLLASFDYDPAALHAEAAASFDDYRSLPAVIRQVLA